MLLLSISLAKSDTFKVILPGNSVPEFSKSIKGQRLPHCVENEWKIEGETYDGTTSCVTNSTLKLRVNPFRCTKYAKKASDDGIIDCLKCNHGFSSSRNTREIFLYTTESTDATEWIIGKGYSPNVPKVTTCLMVSDSHLLKNCDSIQDQIENGISTKSFCIAPKKSNLPNIQFQDMPLVEANTTQCRSFEVKNNLMSCQDNSGRQ